MFKQTIRSIRLSHGETQEKMAEKLDISQRTVASWESGDRMPSIDMLMQIAKVYCVSTDALLGTENGEKSAFINPYLDALENDPKLAALMNAALALSREDLETLILLAKRLASAEK